MKKRGVSTSGSGHGELCKEAPRQGLQTCLRGRGFEVLRLSWLLGLGSFTQGRPPVVFSSHFSVWWWIFVWANFSNLLQTNPGILEVKNTWIHLERELNDASLGRGGCLLLPPSRGTFLALDPIFLGDFKKSRW